MSPNSRIGRYEIVNGKTATVLATNGSIRAAVEKKGEDTQAAADVIVRDVRDALDLVMNPLRLKATLRD